MAILARGVAPFNLLNRFQDDWDQLFGWSRFPEASGLFDRGSFPLVDAVETQEGVTLWIEVPGLDRKELDLTVAGNVLTIQGEKKVPQKEKGKDQGRVFRDDTWTGHYQRSLSLPDTVDPDKVSAEFRDGVLKVTVAKKKEHKPRQVAVAVR